MIKSDELFILFSSELFVSITAFSILRNSVSLLIFCIQWDIVFNLFWFLKKRFSLVRSVQFSSFTQLCPTLWDPINRITPGFPVHHQLPEFTQTHVHWVGDSIQPSHPLSSPSPTFNLSQHQGLFKWVSSLHQVAKLLEFQLQHQSFQWIFRTDFL